MKTNALSIPYFEYAQQSDLPNDEQLLVAKAIEAMSNAYAPYSNFWVGAALQLGNGIVVTGNNQENAAYPSGLCAERVALFYANAQYPNQPVVKMAVVAGKNGQLTNAAITPCGGCRQVMVESEHRQRSPIAIILVGANKILKINSARHLLPFEFDADALANK